VSATVGHPDGSTVCEAGALSRARIDREAVERTDVTEIRALPPELRVGAVCAVVRCLRAIPSGCHWAAMSGVRRQAFGWRHRLVGAEPAAVAGARAHRR